MIIKLKNSHINKGQLPIYKIGACPLFFIFFLLLSNCVNASNTMTFETYVSSPDGAYDRLWLKPRAVLPPPCDEVTLFINSADNEMYFCDVNG